jgi:arylsulfatase A-like enzyme
VVDQIGRLHAELVRIGLDARTILVVTTDHGESLGEHGVHWDHHSL